MQKSSNSKEKKRRQLQAEETKIRLFEAAFALLRERDFSDITIRDIVARAGVSIGTFYVYFPSKLDVFYETYTIADSYFENEVAPHLTESNVADRILHFFQSYAYYNAEVTGIKLTKLLYNPNNKYFLRPGNYGMLRVLTSLITQDISKEGTVCGQMPQTIAEFLMISARGLVYNWCTQDAGYDLGQAMEKYVKYLLKAFDLH